VLTASAFAYAKLAKTGASTTGFKVAGPAGLTIEGKTADMTITDDGATVTIVVPLANLTTGIGLRDDHMKKALETNQYGESRLVVARASLKFPAAGAESSGDAPGKMTLHGQTRDVTFHYSARNDGGTLSVKSNTTIKMNDFGIQAPSYLGVTVKPDVDINSSFQATDN
jgi:polyisoprenoid-binding protein YceI